jgi:hypothetical protein
MLSGIRFLCTLLWRWEAVGVIAAILAGGGISAVYGDDFRLANWLFFSAILVVTIKALTWHEVRTHDTRVWVSIAIIALGFVALWGSHAWIYERESKPVPIAKLSSNENQNKPQTDGNTKATPISSPLPKVTQLGQPSPNPSRSQSKNSSTTKTPDIKVGGDINQETDAPCSANSVGGTVSIEDCYNSNQHVERTTYAPDGIRTLHPAEGFGVRTDDSLRTFSEQFDRLQKDNDWEQLLLLGEVVKKSDPDWPTLEFESSVAHLRMCEVGLGTSDYKRLLAET